MGLNARRRLAVDTLVDIALREQAAPVALAAIARRQRVSLSCLEPLLARLRKAGLVHSTRGPGGGYRLSKEAAAISVSAIVAAVETGAAGEDADEARTSLADDLSQRLHRVMHAHMVTILLSDLLVGQRDAVTVVEASRPWQPSAEVRRAATACLRADRPVRRRVLLPPPESA